MAEALTHVEVARRLAKALNKPLVYIHLSDWVEETRELENPLKEVYGAAPYLRDLDTVQIIVDGSGIIVCDSEEEQERIFSQTVGDEGPTELNPYVGPITVYALTISPDGELGMENT